MIDIPVNEGRLWGSLMRMAEFGALPNGGCCRTALSDEDRKGRDLFSLWCREAGCELGMDQAGNIFARRPGRNDSLPAVATGSHLDTQPHGGKFDGIYGVLAGLEVVRALNDAKVETEVPIEVVVWTNEEGVRFKPPLAGSSAFAGLLEVADLHDAITLDGTRVGEDLAATGYLGEQAPGDHPLRCFIEAHIEQGPILEATGNSIGVVTGVQGIRWSTVVLTGQDAHAGTTPMTARQDALLGAAECIAELNRIAIARDECARLTVGRILVSPNSGATVPGKAEFIMDLRHPDTSVLDDLEARMHQAIRAIAASRGLGATVQRTIDKPPTVFAQEVVDVIRDAAAELDCPHKDMLSGAGHDAMNLARVVPTGMIFVPCRDGVSHNEAESAEPADLAAGAQVLLCALLEFAGRGSFHKP